jgi:IMP dehydrogenase/GMP reductase
LTLWISTKYGSSRYLSKGSRTKLFSAYTTGIASYGGQLTIAVMKNFIINLEEKIIKIEEENNIFRTDLKNKDQIIENLSKQTDELTKNIEIYKHKISKIEETTNKSTTNGQVDTKLNEINIKIDEYITNTNKRLTKNEMELVIKDVSELKSTQEEVNKETYADKIKKQASIIQMVKHEQNEANKKENRVIIFGLPNSESKELTEIASHNETIVNNILKELKVNKETIKTYFRLKQKNDSDIKSTPVIIEFKTNKEKINMLKQARLLRNIEGYNGVYVNQDLTKNESEILKQKIIDRNRKNDEENTKNPECLYYYGIRNFKIMKINKKKD